jgi:hypothetical protein
MSTISEQERFQEPRIRLIAGGGSRRAHSDYTRAVPIVGRRQSVESGVTKRCPWAGGRTSDLQNFYGLLKNTFFALQ